MICNSLKLRRFSLVLVLVGLLLSSGESWASGAICTSFLKKQIDSATKEIVRLVKEIEKREIREERMGLFFEVEPHIQNYFKQVSALRSHEGSGSNPADVPEVEGAIYDLVWDIYKQGDENAGAVKVLRLVSGIHSAELGRAPNLWRSEQRFFGTVVYQSSSIVTDTKVYATAALLNARQGDEEVAQELWVLVNGLKPNPGLDRLFGADNFSDQEIGINQNLIAAGEAALSLAARNGNQRAARLLNSRVEFSSIPFVGTNRL